MGLMRVISGQTVNAKFVRQVIDMLVLPAVYAPVSTSPPPPGAAPKQLIENTPQSPDVPGEPR